MYKIFQHLLKNTAGHRFHMHFVKITQIHEYWTLAFTCLISGMQIYYFFPVASWATDFYFLGAQLNF